MLRRLLAACALCASFAAADELTVSRLRALFAGDHEWRMKEYPEAATFDGFPGQNDRWTDLSADAIERRKQHPSENLNALDSIDRSKLPPEEQLNYDLFRYKTLLEIRGNQFPDELLAIDPLGGGVHSQIPMLLEHSPTRTVKDYEDILSRLRSAPALIEQNIALLAMGVRRGITQPQAVLRDIPSQVDQIIAPAPADSAFLKPFREFPASIPPAEQERLRRAAAALVDGQVLPALRKYRDFLKNTYIPNARKTIALSAMPNGPAWYQYRLTSMNTTTLTPQAVHDIGLAEVARIHKAMEKVIQETGFKGSFSDFVKFLRTDPRFYYTNPADLVMAYRDICKRIDGELPRLFGKLPRTPYGVKEIDAYYAPSQTTAFYEPGPVDGSMSGTYRVNTYKLESRPKFEMEVLSMHESVPGHHLQIALAHEQENVPDFRRQFDTTAFVEGWGLYSESLGYEMGFYKDPYSKFGQLSYDMWRACRLVVDTGMHSLGWSRERAIEFMKENTALTEQNIVVEVDRYIAWPGQATAYKLGQLKILELRHRAEKELGAKFDVRKFHDALLGAGALPLDVLEMRMSDWLKRARQAGS